MSRRPRTRHGRAVTSLSVLAACVPTLLHAQVQEPRVPEEPRVTATWSGTPIQEVLLTLAAVSGRSIVVGAGVEGFVTATITDQPWEATFRAVVQGYGLRSLESESGIIRVEPLEASAAREAADPVVTRVYPLAWVPARELRATLEPLLSERGRIAVSPSGNSLVITDLPRIHAAIAGVLR